MKPNKKIKLYWLTSVVYNMFWLVLYLTVLDDSKWSMCGVALHAALTGLSAVLMLRNVSDS